MFETKEIKDKIISFLDQYDFHLMKLKITPHYILWPSGSEHDYTSVDLSFNINTKKKKEEL